MRRLLVLILLLCLRPAPAQTPPADAQKDGPQLSPQAAYQQAAHPLDIVRHAVQNWSDVEIAALKVATDQAKTACHARTAQQFTGEDLLAYAQLCAFAQEWQPVHEAASNYLIAYSAAGPADKLGLPNVATAFDYEVQASIRLKNPTRAFGTAQTMLRTVPYDDLASDATNSVVRYVQLIDTIQALELLKQRQPILLALLRANATPSVAAANSTHPPLTIHELYADAIALPAMLQFHNEPDAAAASFAELDAALPATLSPDDAILTAASRRQYMLLGAPLPAITASALLLDTPFTVPRDFGTKFGAATILLLFPDWCAQCVSMGPQFTTGVASLGHDNVRFYALLAQAKQGPPALLEAPKLPPAKSAAGTPKSAKTPAPAPARPETPHVEVKISAAPTGMELLMGTPTLIVPRETLNTFVATDFPLMIATDHDGIVRYIQPAPENAMVSGGLVEQVADRIQAQWPPPAPDDAKKGTDYDDSR
jgi:hypothetical protein